MSNSNGSNLTTLLGLGLGAVVGWVVAQQAWVQYYLSKQKVERTLDEMPNIAPQGISLSQNSEGDSFERSHTVEDGIERIVYRPKDRRFETPILMQHGMWHGAWAWENWQKLFAAWGWESHAFSLPGHGQSPPQRPITLCTLDYYLSFLKAEVARLPRTPILMGHSMGGALVQWYLKHVGDDLPAAVMVASWPSHQTMPEGAARFIKLDPMGAVLTSLQKQMTPYVRSPERAANLLITPNATLTPAELYSKLGPESAVVTYQHNPPHWEPPTNLQTPMLWLAASEDATLSEDMMLASAANYGADYHRVEGAGHNVMMEHNYEETAQAIHDWLAAKDIG